MARVQVLDESVYTLSAFSPNDKDIINESKPSVWLCRVGVNMGIFEVFHEIIGMGGCRFCAHGSARYLQVVLPIEFDQSYF